MSPQSSSTSPEAPCCLNDPTGSTAPAAPTPPVEDGGRTLLQVAPPSSSPERTEPQEPRAAQPPADLGGTVAQRLADRLSSEFISRRMEAAGYRLIAPLGEGTYGVVWLAEEESTGIKVAVKFFAHGAGRRWQMLQDEVRQLAALDAARGIVHLKDAVADADPPYYVMSYAEGGSLAQRLEKGPLPVPEALAIFREAVEALAYVHAHGIRHCDLKPGNVLLDRLGKPLVADFGQAHLSNDATLALGTFFYMAPEQADLTEQIPDTRWDVYGLGALLYAMLTGEPPRKDAGLSGELRNTVELGHRLRRYREGIGHTPKPTAHYRVRGVDRRLARIIDACLELDPKRRLPGAEAVLAALRRRRARLRQRPLLLAGMIAPLVVLATLLAVGATVAEQQIAASKAILVEQVKNNDKATARLAAAGLEMGFQKRLGVVAGMLDPDRGDWPRQIAEAAEARRAAEAGDAGKQKDWLRRRAGLEDWLKGAAEKEQLDRFFVSRLIVADRDGFILASASQAHGWGTSSDFEERIAPRNWSWRDWFSGRGNGDEGTRRPPVDAPHISQPYRSTQDGLEYVAFTVPVALPGEAGGPVGVLVGGMKWADLSKWLDQLKLENGQVAVFNDRGQFLRHKHGGGDDVLAGLRDSRDNPAVYDALSAELRGGTNTLDSYEDPIDHQRYLAGYKTFDPYAKPGAALGGDEPGAAGRWGVVVQHNKAEVLRPVDDLHRQLKSIGLGVLASAGLLIGGMWWGLIWLLRRQERLGHG